MTNIAVTIRDGVATAELTGILTTGMVGVPVTFDLGPEWEDLTIIAVIRGNGLIFDRPLLGTRQTTVPYEVLEKVGEHIFIGAEGCSASGDLVIQSNFAEVEETVRQGADPSGDIAIDPTQPIWAELMHEVEGLQESVKSRIQTVNGIAPDENGNVNVDGVSAEEKELILSLFRNAAYTADMSATFAQLSELWGIEAPEEPDVPDEPEEPDVPVVTLTSISATYSGGDVPVGTAVTDLTGIVVTAHYSDGTSKAVTDYTLSGTIAEGANTITVSYGGKSTTFAVTGVAEEEPVYQLAEETTFDGTTSIDTGYALFDTDRDWTICVDVTFGGYGGNVFELPYSGHSAQTPAVGLHRYAGGYIRLQLYGLTNQIPNAGSVKLVITRKAGMVNTKYATAHYATENTVTTLTCKANREFTAIPDVTLNVGGFKGTIHDLKIYEQILGETEIADYLGVSA